MPEWVADLTATTVLSIAFLLVLRLVSVTLSEMLRGLRNDVRQLHRSVLDLRAQSAMLSQALIGADSDNVTERNETLDALLQETIRTVNETKEELRKRPEQKPSPLSSLLGLTF